MQRRAHFAMLLYAALISASFSIGDRITEQLHPRVLTSERFVFGAVAFAIVARLRGDLRRPRPSDLARYAGIALTMVGFFVLMFEALRYTDAVHTGALFTVLPLMTAATARAVVGQKTTPFQWLWMTVGAAGAASVVFDGELERALRLELGTGEWIFLAALSCFALYSPLVKRLHRGESAVVMTLWTLVTGLVMLVALSATEILATDWAAVPWWAHAGVAYLGIVNTAGTFMLAKFASTRLPSAKVMAYTFLTPVFVVLLEGLLGEGWPSPELWIGLAVTALATVVFVTSGPKS